MILVLLTDPPQAEDDRVRVGLVPSAPSTHASLIQTTLQTQSKKVWSTVREILSTDSPVLEDGEWRLADRTTVKSSADVDEIIRDHVTFVSQCVGMTPEQSTAIIANGRVSDKLYTQVYSLELSVPIRRNTCPGC